MVIRKPHHGPCDEKLGWRQFFVALACVASSPLLVAAIAGQRSAILYSIVVSCQRHGKDPHAYLKDVLTRLPAMTNQDDLSALTPAHWSPA